MTIREIFKLGYTRATKATPNGTILVARSHMSIFRNNHPITSMGTVEGLIRAAERDHGVEDWQPEGRKYHRSRYIVQSHVWVPGSAFMMEHGPHCICDTCHGARPHSDW